MDDFVQSLRGIFFRPAVAGDQPSFFGRSGFFTTLTPVGAITTATAAGLAIGGGAVLLGAGTGIASVGAGGATAAEAIGTAGSKAASAAAGGTEAFTQTVGWKVLAGKALGSPALNFVGGLAAANFLLPPTIQNVGGALGQTLPTVGVGAGLGAEAFGAGVGAGIGEGLRNSLGGLGQGLFGAPTAAGGTPQGGFLQNAESAVGSGLSSLLLPILLIGGLFIALNLSKRKGGK